ncbi:MAG: hypothetical protein P8179_24915, partial [Candidatus Thiodiazotropha sp.]
TVPYRSAMDPRLDTGGWLALARRGLSPRKIRRALLGAITFRVTGRTKLQSEAAQLCAIRVYVLVKYHAL